MKRLVKIIFKCISLGLWCEPFDRKKFREEKFPFSRRAFMFNNNPEKDIANALHNIYEFNVVNYEEAKRDVAIANIRSLVAVWIAIISLVASVVVSIKGIRQAHADSESTTAALVEALSKISNR